MRPAQSAPWEGPELSPPSLVIIQVPGESPPREAGSGPRGGGKPVCAPLLPNFPSIVPLGTM